MDRIVHRLLALALLAVWLAPAALALALGLHVALDHHADPSDELALELARAAAHGHHHHAEVDSGHEHDAIIHGGKPIVRTGAKPVSFLRSADSPESSLTVRSVPEQELRRGPPEPLFATNCSLLL